MDPSFFPTRSALLLSSLQNLVDHVSVVIKPEKIYFGEQRQLQQAISCLVELWSNFMVHSVNRPLISHALWLPTKHDIKEVRVYSKG